MNTNEIEKTLLGELAVVLDAQVEDLDPQQPLADLGLDSMGFVEILVFIERVFGLKLVQSGLEKDHFRTVRSLAGRIAVELDPRH